MKNCIQENLKYLLYSKKILYLTIFSIAILLGVQVLNYFSVNEYYDEYNKRFETYSAQGFNAEEEANQEYSFSGAEDGSSGTLNNPLAYYKDMTEKYVNSISPPNAITQMQEISVILFPLILVILSVMITSMDRKGKNYKIKKVKYSKKQYFFARELTIYIASTLILTITFLFGKIANYIIYRVAMNKMELEGFFVYDLKTTSLKILVIRWIILLLFVIVIVELSSVVSNIFKSSGVGIVTLYIYFFVINWKQKWDLNNSIHYLYKKYFDMNGIVTINSYKVGINNYSCLLIIGILILVSFTINYFVEIKRSGFNA